MNKLFLAAALVGAASAHSSRLVNRCRPICKRVYNCDPDTGIVEAETKTRTRTITTGVNIPAATVTMTSTVMETIIPTPTQTVHPDPNAYQQCLWKHGSGIFELQGDLECRCDPNSGIDGLCIVIEDPMEACIAEFGGMPFVNEQGANCQCVAGSSSPACTMPSPYETCLRSYPTGMWTGDNEEQCYCTQSGVTCIAPPQPLTPYEQCMERYPTGMWTGENGAQCYCTNSGATCVAPQPLTPYEQCIEQYPTGMWTGNSGEQCYCTNSGATCMAPVTPLTPYQLCMEQYPTGTWMDASGKGCYCSESGAVCVAVPSPYDQCVADYGASIWMNGREQCECTLQGKFCQIIEPSDQCFAMYGSGTFQMNGQTCQCVVGQSAPSCQAPPPPPPPPSNNGGGGGGC